MTDPDDCPHKFGEKISTIFPNYIHKCELCGYEEYGRYKYHAEKDGFIVE